MTWELVALVAVCLAFAGVAMWLGLPYLRKRSDEETRLAALEAASVALTDRLARVEQVFEGPGVRGLPRMGVSR